MKLSRYLGEFLGTTFLLMAVVGSGIMGDRLSGGNTAIALLANSLATGSGLVVLILMFGPVSGAHFNPCVTLSFATDGELPWSDALFYLLFQFLGGIVGVVAANAMFGEPLVSLSSKERLGGGQLLGEFIATFGLILTIRLVAKTRPHLVALAVGAYITAAYWFTSSTSFANPAVTIGRSLTDTFTGIRPADMPGFLAAQLSGAAVASFTFRFLKKTGR